MASKKSKAKKKTQTLSNTAKNSAAADKLASFLPPGTKTYGQFAVAGIDKADAKNVTNAVADKIVSIVSDENSHL